MVRCEVGCARFAGLMLHPRNVKPPYFHRSRSEGVSWRRIGERFTDAITDDWRSTEDGPMLVLSRKLGEKIYIGDNICITVVDIDRGKIRLGIEAPRDVPIYRQELLPLHQQKAIEGQQNLPAVS